MSTSISVVVSTYNRPDALDACLRGLARQSDRLFEVIVADDGSGQQTAAVVAQWQGRIGVPLRHVWQPDRGFRAAESRNRAIRASSGEICIFLDGDCIPRSSFVAAHRRLSQPGRFVAGNRVLLGPELTRRVLANQLEPETWPLSAWLRARLAGEVNRILPLASLPLGPLRGLNAGRWQGARSANLAVRRADLVTVDGFDAGFTGWGLEDTDLVLRLLRHGVRRRDGRFATAVIHLWHPEADRSGLPENERRLALAASGSSVQPRRGLSALEGPALPVRTADPAVSPPGESG